MLSPNHKKSLIAIAAIIGLGYPFLVYFGLTWLPPKILIGVVLGALLVRVIIMRSTLPASRLLIWPAILAISVMTIGAVIQGQVAIKLYPVVISFALCAAFIGSVIKPPSIIEIIARLREPDMPQSGVIYTRRVTVVWGGYFLLNGMVASWTALYGTIEQWTLYNGFVSYCLTGCLFAGEYLVRKRFRAKGN